MAPITLLLVLWGLDCFKMGFDDVCLACAGELREKGELDSNTEDFGDGVLKEP